MINNSKQDLFLKKIADFSDKSDLINLKNYLNDQQYHSFFSQRIINDLFITNFNTKPHIAVINYLLNDQHLPFNAQIDYANQICMQLSLNNEDVTILNYLLTTQQGKSLLNIHHNQDRLYKNICDIENLEFLSYLILEYQIDFNKEMQIYNNVFAKETFHQKALDLFALRDLNEKLNHNIVNLPLTSSPKKAKI